jgi:hypothetical protein
MHRPIAIAVTAILASLLGWAPARAQSCPPASVGGRTVAVITVDGVKVPVKSITFVNGGPLDPPHTNKAAGISARNRPLDARKGSTVITWHVRYGPGCPGALNALTRLPLGSTFTAGRVGTAPATYRITARESYPKGTIKASWFRHSGPRKLMLITCDDYAGGVFRRTMAIQAVPVAAVPVAAVPVAAVPVGRSIAVPHGAAPVAWRLVKAGGRASL